MRTITVTIPEKGEIELRLDRDVLLRWDENDPERLARAIISWLALIDLSRKLKLTEKEAKEVEKRVREGIRRRVNELLSSSTQT